MSEDKPAINKWRGQKRYACRLCAFDTLEEAKFIEHFAKAHAPFRVIEGDKNEAVQEAQPKKKDEE